MELTIKNAVYQSDERDAFSFNQLREEGVLFMINRLVFHPRGYALALEYADGETEPRGWNIIGDGTEIWCFYHEEEQEPFERFKSLLESAPTTLFEPKV
jgi:hypothetical protein